MNWSTMPLRRHAHRRAARCPAPASWPPAARPGRRRIQAGRLGGGSRRARVVITCFVHYRSGTRRAARSTSRAARRRRRRRPMATKLPSSLSVSRTSTGRPPASALKTETQVDGADGVVVVIQQADGHEAGLEVGRHLLCPLPSQATDHAAVVRVDVAADADRVAIVQANVAPRPAAAHQEDVAAIAQREVRNDLLPGRVVLGVAAAAESAVTVDRRPGTAPLRR